MLSSPFWFPKHLIEKPRSGGNGYWKKRYRSQENNRKSNEFHQTIDHNKELLQQNNIWENVSGSHALNCVAD